MIEETTEERDGSTIEMIDEDESLKTEETEGTMKEGKDEKASGQI